jgi:Vitamin K epoxide reductase family
MKGTQYTAACDTTWASCSKVLSSKYAHILSAWGLVEKGSTFDLSNAIMGAAYYALALVLAGSRSPAAKNVLLAASFGSLCFSFYLAYILKFVLNDTCIVSKQKLVLRRRTVAGATTRGSGRIFTPILFSVRRSASACMLQLSSASSVQQEGFLSTERSPPRRSRERSTKPQPLLLHPSSSIGCSMGSFLAS